MSDPEIDSKEQVDHHAAGHQVRSGLYVGCLIHFLALPLLLMASGATGYIFVFFCFGLSQLIYMIPAISYAKSRRSSPEFLKGMGLSMALLFIVNAACFGLIMVG